MIFRTLFKFSSLFYRIFTLSSASILLVLSDFNVQNIVAATTILITSIPDYFNTSISAIYTKIIDKANSILGQPPKISKTKIDVSDELLSSHKKELEKVIYQNKLYQLRKINL